MKTAVETVFVGEGPTLQSPLPADVPSHYLVDPVACTPASGWEKEQVESQVGLVREGSSRPELRFQELRRAERLASGSMHRPRQSASSSGPERADDLRGVRGGTAEARSLYQSLRSGYHAVPASVSRDLPGPLRQQRSTRSAASTVSRPSSRVHAYADRVVVRQDGRVVSERPRALQPRHDSLRSLASRCRCSPVSQAHSAIALPSRPPYCRPPSRAPVPRELARTNDGDRQMSSTSSSQSAHRRAADGRAGLRRSARPRRPLRRRHPRRSRPPAQLQTTNHHRHAGPGWPFAVPQFPDCARYDPLKKTFRGRTQGIDLMGGLPALRHEG